MHGKANNRVINYSSHMVLSCSAIDFSPTDICLMMLPGNWLQGISTAWAASQLNQGNAVTVEGHTWHHKRIQTVKAHANNKTNLDISHQQISKSTENLKELIQHAVVMKINTEKK